MGLEFQNATPPTVFISCQPNFMRTLGYHGGIQATTFLDDRPRFKYFVALLNFNIGVKWKPKIWNISKRLSIEQNRRKFATRGTTVHICRVLLIPTSLSLVWGHSVHFAKFLTSLFLKHYSFNSFHQIPTSSSYKVS